MSDVGDFFNNAFGAPLDIANDKDASLKIILDVLVHDQRWEDILNLITGSNGIGALGGEPGWLLTRRNHEAPSNEYLNWPKDAMFRSQVDPTVLELGQPEAFYQESVFSEFLRRVVDVIRRQFNPHARDFAQLMDLLRSLEK